MKFIERKIGSLNELKDEADVVIHCSGLGARDLVGDLTVRPARGQVRSIYSLLMRNNYSLGNSSSCSMD